MASNPNVGVNVGGNDAAMLGLGYGPSTVTNMWLFNNITTENASGYAEPSIALWQHERLWWRLNEQCSKSVS